MSRLLILIFLFFASKTFSQNSSVVLSSLKVIEIVDPSSHELDNFLIEVSASDPASLSRVVISLMENSALAERSITIPVTVKDGKAQLDLEKHSVPFKGQNVKLMLKVRDQFRTPYQSVQIKGYDLKNLETNPLTYTRNK